MVVVSAVKLCGARVGDVGHATIVREDGTCWLGLFDAAREQGATSIWWSRAVTRQALAHVKPLAAQEVPILHEMINILASHIVAACIRLVARWMEHLVNINLLLSNYSPVS